MGKCDTMSRTILLDGCTMSLGDDLDTRDTILNAQLTLAGVMETTRGIVTTKVIRIGAILYAADNYPRPALQSESGTNLQSPTIVPRPRPVTGANGAKSSTSPARGRAMMREWMNQSDNPYPSAKQKLVFMELGNLTRKQVDSWFKNARARDSGGKKRSASSTSPTPHPKRTLPPHIPDAPIDESIAHSLMELRGAACFTD